MRIRMEEGKLKYLDEEPPMDALKGCSSFRDCLNSFAKLGSDMLICRKFLSPTRDESFLLTPPISAKESRDSFDKDDELYNLRNIFFGAILNLMEVVDKDLVSLERSVKSDHDLSFKTKSSAKGDGPHQKSLILLHVRCLPWKRLFANVRDMISSILSVHQTYKKVFSPSASFDDRKYDIDTMRSRHEAWQTLHKVFQNRLLNMNQQLARINGRHRKRQQGRQEFRVLSVGSSDSHRCLHSLTDQLSQHLMNHMISPSMLQSVLRRTTHISLRDKERPVLKSHFLCDNILELLYRDISSRREDMSLLRRILKVSSDLR